MTIRFEEMKEIVAGIAKDIEMLDDESQYPRGRSSFSDLTNVDTGGFVDAKNLESLILDFLKRDVGPISREINKRHIQELWEKFKGFSDLINVVQAEKKRRQDWDARCQKQKEAFEIINESGRFLFADVKTSSLIFDCDGNEESSTVISSASLLERRFYLLPNTKEFVLITVKLISESNISSVNYSCRMMQLNLLRRFELDFTNGHELIASDILELSRDCSTFSDEELKELDRFEQKSI